MSNKKNNDNFNIDNLESNFLTLVTYNIKYNKHF